MPISPAGIALLKDFEEWRSVSYYDSQSVETVGWGHRVIEPNWLAIMRSGRTFTITPDRGESLFSADLSVAEFDAAQLLDGHNCDPVRFDALVIMAFQLGNQLLAWPRFLSQIRLGRWQAAAWHAGDSKWASAYRDRAGKLFPAQSPDRARHVLAVLASGVHFAKQF